MTDQELIEMAAKASGFGVVLAMPISRTETDYVIEESDGGPLKRWNPLADDGDALRLAVKLGLHVKICRRMVLVEGRELGDDQFERLTPDPYAATRRAIVRSAAEIGKSMEKSQ